MKLHRVTENIKKLTAIKFHVPSFGPPDITVHYQFLGALFDVICDVQSLAQHHVESIHVFLFVVVSYILVIFVCFRTLHLKL